ncbi:MAG: ABC transporter substrate-binding protein, partial [Pseudomonadota bacterium]
LKRKYGIGVEYSLLRPEQYVKRVQEERAAGRYPWDVFIGGSGTLFSNLKRLGALEPIESALILPDVKDPGSWRGGRLPFSDRDRLALFFLYETAQRVFINTIFSKPEDITSYRDLLKPQWKGKILISKDPRDPGSGRYLFMFFYTHKDLGPDFIRELAQRDLMLPKDADEADLWLTQGKYAICFCNNAQAARLALIREGVPLKPLDPHLIKEGGSVSTTFANVGFANRAPNPNAAKVLINWLLSQEAGTILSKVTGLASPRADVSNEFAKPFSVPGPGWSNMGQEEIQAKEPEMVKLVEEVFGEKGL